MENIERKVLAEGQSIMIPRRIKHRIVREKNKIYIEISTNGYAGFMQFSKDATYSRLCRNYVGRSPIPQRELNRYLNRY